MRWGATGFSTRKQQANNEQIHQAIAFVVLKRCAFLGISKKDKYKDMYVFVKEREKIH